MTMIRLPWPSSKLSGHAKGHWRPKAAATKEARAAAFWASKQQHLAKDPYARLVFAFYPPDKRRRDLQNMPGMMKAYIDGIADAMGCDDNGFRCAFPETFDAIVKGGAVVVRVESAGFIDMPVIGTIS